MGSVPKTSISTRILFDSFEPAGKIFSILAIRRRAAIGETPPPARTSMKPIMNGYSLSSAAALPDWLIFGDLHVTKTTRGGPSTPRAQQKIPVADPTPSRAG